MPVRAPRVGKRAEQRRDGEVGLGARQQGCRAVADGPIGEERDQAVASPGRGAAQDRKRTLSVVLIDGASRFDQGFDRRFVVLGELGERAECAPLPQHSKGRPRVADLRGRPLTARLKDVHGGNRLIVVGIEVSHGLSDDHGV
jgi:hypothetical protein